MREEVRNKLLRRVDWRFLLVNPQPAKSICFANGVLREAVGLISSQVIDAETVASEECDLAVLVDPSHDSLHVAWAALRPGGSIYTEWYSPLACGFKRVRGSLERLGFEQVDCYWPWPWPRVSSPRFWVPLGAPGALRHFVVSRPFPRSVMRRLGSVILRSLWRMVIRMGVAVPICAVARKPESSISLRLLNAKATRGGAEAPRVASSTSTNILDTIRAEWNGWELGPLPNHFSSLLLTGGPRSISKVVRILFTEPDHRPSIAIKMARVPDAVRGLAREAETLRALGAQCPGRVQGIPRLLFCREYAGLLAVGETAAIGRPLWTLLRRRNYNDFAMKVTHWLADLAGRRVMCAQSLWWDRLIESVLADFIESFGPIIDHGMVRETRAILTKLGPLPLVCEQRDFAPWNVLVTPDSELAVLDWESAELEGLPGLDLIYFLTYFAFFIDGAMSSDGLRKSYRANWDPLTLTGEISAACFEHYFNQTGLNPATLKPLRLLVWLIHSRSEFAHFKADVAGQPGKEDLRRSLFVKLWEEEVRCH